MAKPYLTMDVGLGHREYIFLAVGRVLSRVREVALDQQQAVGMGRKAALWGEQGRDGRENCCGQRVIKHLALTATSIGQCPYPGISIRFACSLVSWYNVFSHLGHEVPQGKIQNLITMQIQLGCSSLTSPIPQSFFSLLKNHAQPFFSILPLEASIYLPVALLDLCRWVYSLSSL